MSFKKYLAPEAQESLSRRQTLWVVVVALVAGLLMSLAVMVRDYVQTSESIEKSARQILQSVEISAAYAAYTIDKNLANDILAGLFKFESVSSARFTGELGQLLAESYRPIKNKTQWGSALFGENLVFLIQLNYQPIKSMPKKYVGVLEIVVNGGSTAHAYFDRVCYEALMGLLRAGILAWLMLFVNQYLVIKPLQDVAHNLEEYARSGVNNNNNNIDAISDAPKNLKILTIPATHENDEIGLLVKRINELLYDADRHMKESEVNMASLARANAELTRLGEVMAHHFQEPARRLASFSQRLLSKSNLATDIESQQSLHFINTQARRLSELVRDAQRYLALDYTKLGMGMGTSADSATALHQSIKALGDAAVNADIVLLEPLPEIQLAEKFLCDLFTIFLDNALRYRHPERPLRIEVSAQTKGKRAVFRFTDNGSGILPEYREQVLGLFTRLVPNTIPGTGMGLALAYKMTLLAGGHFGIENGLEGGTSIVFDLPLKSLEATG